MVFHITQPPTRLRQCYLGYNDAVLTPFSVCLFCVYGVHIQMCLWCTPADVTLTLRWPNWIKGGTLPNTFILLTDRDIWIVVDLNVTIHRSQCFNFNKIATASSLETHDVTTHFSQDIAGHIINHLARGRYLLYRAIYRTYFNSVCACVRACVCASQIVD